MKPVAILLLVVCSVGLSAAEKKGGLIALADAEALPKDQQEAQAAVVAAIEREGMKPAEYFAEVESKEHGKVLAFQLWHESALKQRGDPSTRGDPSGKCRTALYDLSTKKVTKIYGWR